MRWCDTPADVLLKQVHLGNVRVRNQRPVIAAAPSERWRATYTVAPAGTANLRLLKSKDADAFSATVDDWAISYFELMPIVAAQPWPTEQSKTTMDPES